ncbi:MAG: sodium:solute symporter [Gemmatimonadaceae bacterium]
MHPLDWVVVVGYLGYVVWDGLRRARGTTDIEGYFLANRSLPWWAVGLSVMATQLSAITLVGTTGQGATDGLRFVQFYFGLPLAMVLLGVTLVPFLHKAKVYTAYEYLERRFDGRTRTLTSLLFLVSRGLSCGAIISAPAVVLSAVLGWPLASCVALIGVPTVLYTVVGGVQAVTWADVKQMVVIVGAVAAMAVVLLTRIPVPLDDALAVAGAAGRLRVFDLSFSLENPYTVWSGLIGGTFLMLSYFGTDQSQVQRYLAARSVDEARSSLLISAYWKIPLQALILLLGVLVFLYHVFQTGPLYHNPAHERAMRAAAPATLDSLTRRYADVSAARATAARAMVGARTADDPAALADATAAYRGQEREADAVRAVALAEAGKVVAGPTRDVNYVIPRFVLDVLPVGLVGLFLAAVLAAAMSSIAAELNSLSTATIVDFYRRRFVTVADEAHYLRASKWATALWGAFACVIALYAATLGSLIEVVNRFGSFFYGSILGVFLLAMLPRARARGAFGGLIAGMATVGAVSVLRPDIAFLWHNVIGAVAVVVVGLLLSATASAPDTRSPAG